MDTSTIMERAAQRKLIESVKPHHMEEFHRRDFYLACANVLKEINNYVSGCPREALSYMLHSPGTIDAALAHLDILGLIRHKHARWASADTPGGIVYWINHFMTHEHTSV